MGYPRNSQSIEHPSASQSEIAFGIDGNLLPHSK